MAKEIKKSSKKITFLLVFSLAMLMITPSLTIIILGGILPTLIAYLVDVGEKKSLTVCVGMMNLAGVLPVVVYCYEYYPIWGAVNPEIYQLKNWIIIYIAAFMGLCLYWVLPGMVVKLYTVYLKQKIKAIEKQKIKLESRYGKENLVDENKIL